MYSEENETAPFTLSSRGDRIVHLNKWDTRFVEMADLVATWSKDPDRRVGSVIVSDDMRKISVGFNGFPRGIADTEERLSDRDIKLKLMVHAERNALDNADFPLSGCTIYVTTFPCAECAKGIIQKGIRRVVAPIPDYSNIRWGNEWLSACRLLHEAKVETIYYSEVKHWME